MSNLKLPDMSYKSLSALNKSSMWKKIAYQTFIKRDSESTHVVKVKHFNTVIANISATKVVIYPWHSHTTVNRLNAIVYANCGHFIGIRKINGNWWQTVVRYKDGNEYPINGETIFFTKDMNNG